MTSRCAQVVFMLTAAAGCAAAQTAEPKFEAVSIHELEPPWRVLGKKTVSGSLVTLEGYSVSMLAGEAYDKKRYELAIPPPKRFAYFSVEARAPRNTAGDPKLLQAMLRNMLAERFHLRTHREMRNVPVYALVVSKGGPRLKEGSGDQPCRQVSGPVIPTDRNYRISQENCPMETLIRMLGDADRPVIDKTDLKGRYDVSIFYTPNFRMTNGTEPTDISILDTVHQLGLQFEKRDEPMEIVVVDSYDDLPSGN